MAKADNAGKACTACIRWIREGGDTSPDAPLGRHPIYADNSWEIPHLLPRYIGSTRLPLNVKESQFLTEINEYLASGKKITVLPAMPDSSYDGFFKTHSIEWSPYGQFNDPDSCTEKITQEKPQS